MSEYIVRIPPDMPYEIRAELNAWYVESEPIVRCRDCKHYMDYEHEYEPNLGYCREHDREEVRDSGFCAWGESLTGSAHGVSDVAELYVFIGIVGFAMALIIVMMWRDDD